MEVQQKKKKKKRSPELEDILLFCLKAEQKKAMTQLRDKVTHTHKCAHMDSAIIPASTRGLCGATIQEGAVCKGGAWSNK